MVYCHRFHYRADKGVAMSWIGIIPFKDDGMTSEMYELLQELAETSSYWSNALRFINSISNRKSSTLSSRQRDWLFDIIASLRDDVNKQTARKLFQDSPKPAFDEHNWNIG